MHAPPHDSARRRRAAVWFAGVCDVYDAAALNAAVAGFRPHAVMHQLTDLRPHALFVQVRFKQPAG